MQLFPTNHNYFLDLNFFLVIETIFYNEQDGPSHHQTSADRRMTSRKWSKEENRVVMQRYYKCEYGRNGYRKRMHAIWNEIGMINVTDQTFLKGIMGCYSTN